MTRSLAKQPRQSLVAGDCIQEITPTSLVLKDDTPRDKYEEIGAQLGRAESGINWFLGDWLAFGERKWGELKATVEEVGLNYGTCRNSPF